MNIKDVRLKKGMSREEVNELIGNWLTLEDNIYFGSKYRHNWKCKCGNVFGRNFNDIKGTQCVICNDCKDSDLYKVKIESSDIAYTYIKTIRTGEILLNDKIAKVRHVRIRHKYCNSIYDIPPSQFITNNVRCAKCCGKYENSFAYHIEVELGESLDKYWDFEKNTVNPYHISKKTDSFKIWIKCQDKEYHESYETNCYNFVIGRRCPYCINHKIHPYDSFAQYHINNTDKDFLTKYWSDKNTIDPWTISPSSSITKVWIKCQEKEYHDDYEISCSNFTKKSRGCPYCSSKKIHPKDSFAQYHIDHTDPNFLEKYWGDKNTVDPWSIAPNSNKCKIWINCIEKDYHGQYVTNPNNFTTGNRCPYCVNQKVHPKDSFAQYHIDNTDKDFLTKYWSDKNKIDPWTIPPVCTTKVFIKCQEHDYHNDKGGYHVSCANFTNGKRCSYCVSKILHPIDSFGGVNLYAVSYWSENNNISPFKVNKSGNKKYKFICPECGIEFMRLISSITRSRNVLCDKCNSSIGEMTIYNLLTTLKINFIPQKEFDGLIGIRGGNLSYDFYLPDYNLLIEYQGEQHERFIKGMHGKIDVFHRQQEHDKRKREYAYENGYNLLEIWYYDFDNIEEILNKELNI